MGIFDTLYMKLVMATAIMLPLVDKCTFNS
jgi:hypothetical protein